MKRLSSILLLGFAIAILAQHSQDTKKDKSSAQSSSTALDRMIAADKSPQQLAQYVFDTHGCSSCHTLGHDGKLGYTANGKDKARAFEGCINMLTAMTVIVQVPEDKRSPQQRRKAEHFEEFGCTACHRLAPGKLGLTEEGAKLAHLHLGCVDVEKVVASGPAPQRW